MKTETLLIPHGNNTIYGTLFLPDGEGPFPTILLSHGYNGIGKDFEKECKYYAEHGYVCFAHDFCGGSTRSKSTGKSTDMTVFTERDDLLCIFDHISSLPFVDQKNLFLFGGSQGGFVSTLVAECLKEKVRALGLYYPAYCIPDNWREKYPTLDNVPKEIPFWGLTLGNQFVESIHNFYPFKEFGSYQGNVFIIHGDKDEIVPIRYAEKAKVCYPSLQISVLSGEGHGFTPKGGKIAMEQMLAFFEKEKI